MDHLHELDFAYEQLERVRQGIRIFLETDPYALVSDHDEQAGRYRVRAMAFHETPPRIRSNIGTVLNSLRQSLDYLAMRVVEGTGSPKKLGKVEFPIYKTSEFYAHEKTGAHVKIGAASPEAQTIFEGLQPYHRGAAEDHPLWMLHDLGRQHKHRRHVITGAVSRILRFQPKWGAFKSMSAVESIAVGAFEDGAVLAEWEVAPGPMEVEIDASFDVAFDKEGPAHGAPVLPTLKLLCHFVRDIVIPEFKPFL